MGILYKVCILFLLYFPVAGQIVFDQLPHDLQLYPRDASNQAVVPIRGIFNVVGYSKVSVQVLREGKVVQALSQTISSTASGAPFSLSATIKAEPAEYSFRVFTFRGSDSTLIAERKRVVCGDVYILYGQSNILAQTGLDEYFSTTFDDKYLRNAIYPGGSMPTEMTWYPAKQPFGSVGAIGLTIQRLILQNHGIPTCILNGAVSGTPIAQLMLRDEANHANTYTFYGNLLYRAQWAGVAKQVKAILWRQGEADAGAGTPGYDQKFTTLYNQFREDYGNTRIYVGQINILDNSNAFDYAATIRDFQRRTKYLFNNVETIATVGTPGYEGVHYNPLAYQRLAFEQYRQLARDFYGSTDTSQINSPDVKKVFFNARKDSITLVYDDQMQMVWTKDTATYSFATGARMSYYQQKEFFYLDGQAGWLSGGAAKGNRIVLGLNLPTTTKTIRYLPAYFSNTMSTFYDGPTLRNARGMRAFSFDNVPIADAIATVALAAKPLTEKQIQLNWTASAGAQTQILERSDSTATKFIPIATLNGSTATFNDTNIPNKLGTYFYRLRAYSSTSESAYSNVVLARPLALGVEPSGLVVQLYPNPLNADRVVQVRADQVTFTRFTVHNMLGQVVKSWQGTARNTVSLDLTGLEAGLYLANLQTADAQTLQRKIVIH